MSYEKINWSTRQNGDTVFVSTTRIPGYSNNVETCKLVIPAAITELIADGITNGELELTEPANMQEVPTVAKRWERTYASR